MKWYRWIKGWFVQWNDFLAQILRKRYPRVKKEKEKKKEDPEFRTATRGVHWFRSNYRGQCRVSNAALKFQSVFNYGRFSCSSFHRAPVSPRKSDKERYLRGNTCVQRAWCFFVPRKNMFHLNLYWFGIFPVSGENWNFYNLIWRLEVKNRGK